MAVVVLCHIKRVSLCVSNAGRRRAAATASDVKIRSVRAEIGKANNAEKKERERETGERRNVERINIVATELCGNAAAAAANGSPE